LANHLLHCIVLHHLGPSANLKYHLRELSKKNFTVHFTDMQTPQEEEKKVYKKITTATSLGWDSNKEKHLDGQL